MARIVDKKESQLSLGKVLIDLSHERIDCDHKKVVGRIE
jgi:hypothetical protein